MSGGALSRSATAAAESLASRWSQPRKARAPMTLSMARRVAESGEQATEPLALLEDALAGAPLALELAAEAAVLRGNGAFGYGR